MNESCIWEGRWFVTFKKQHRVRIFESRAFRKIFWPIREEVKGNWRKLHNEELLHNQ
jgi:hypothetical protein